MVPCCYGASFESHQAAACSHWANTGYCMCTHFVSIGPLSELWSRSITIHVLVEKLGCLWWSLSLMERIPPLLKMYVLFCQIISWSHVPSQNPLPLLSSAAVVENLQAQESKRYYRGYRGASAMPADAARKAYILQAIGCKVFWAQYTVISHSTANSRNCWNLWHPELLSFRDEHPHEIVGCIWE